MSATYIEFRNQTAAPGAPPQLVFGVAQHPDDQSDMHFWGLDPAIDPLARFDAQSIDPVLPGIFRQTGESIFAELSKHPDFKQFYDGTLAAPLGSPNRMVLIRCKTESVAHAFPWEALHGPDGFAALQRQLPFARLVKAKNPRQEAVFDGTLRLVAVIGAAGEDGTPEWAALRKALGAWQGAVAVLVFVDSIDLRDEVTRAKLPGVTAELMPEAADELLRRIGQHLPHFVHVFCHGNPDGGGQLEIANLLTASGEAPMVIGAARLARQLDSAWLVTLNACDSAGAVEPGTASFACTLVEEQGVPCVVGMRQRIGANVAHVFARAFLGDVLAELDRAWSSAAASWTPNFGPALTTARDEIVTAIGLTPPRAGEQKAWTLPIMCSASTPFRVGLRQPADPAAIERQAELAQLRAFVVDASQPAAIRAQIEQRIAELTAAPEG